jgi:hypothetical protein
MASSSGIFTHPNLSVESRITLIEDYNEQPVPVKASELRTKHTEDVSIKLSRLSRLLGIFGLSRPKKRTAIALSSKPDKSEEMLDFEVNKEPKTSRIPS